MIERWAKSLVFASEARRHPHAPTKAHVQTQLLGNRNRHGLDILQHLLVCRLSFDVGGVHERYSWSDWRT